jgi:quercetin dioxygenase-like cupin family protein
MPRHLYLAALPAAFAAGLFVSHVSSTAYAQGAAQSTGLSAQIILRTKTLVATHDGTIALQSGNVPRHTHAGSDEIQYVISGSGTFWLGDQQREIHPGDLIVIPRGTQHAGSHPSSGEFKVLSIKLPPQAQGDMQMVP